MAAVVALTLAEASAVLDPPVSERQLRAIVTALHWQPADHRHNGRTSGGRPAAAYDAAEIMRLHAAIAPWLGDSRRIADSLEAADAAALARIHSKPAQDALFA